MGRGVHAHAHTTTDPASDYQYFWWLNTLNGEDRHFYASGKYGQYIYVDPENDLVIVRLGKEAGERACGYWISLFDDLVTKLDTSVEGSS